MTIDNWDFLRNFAEKCRSMKNPAKIDIAVLILFFNRPKQLQGVFDEVRKARPSRLFLYQDGPRGERDMAGIEACRRIVDDIDWECDIHRMYQEQNYGCDPSEYISQKWAFSMADKCIVLEDVVFPVLQGDAGSLRERPAHQYGVWF